MHDHPPGTTWLAVGIVLLVLFVLHAWLVLKLAASRPDEQAWTMKPRTWWLLLLVVLNPLWPLTFLVVIAFAIKSIADGLPRQDERDLSNRGLAGTGDPPI